MVILVFAIHFLISVPQASAGGKCEPKDEGTVIAQTEHYTQNMPNLEEQLRDCVHSHASITAKCKMVDNFGIQIGSKIIPCKDYYPDMQHFSDCANNAIEAIRKGRCYSVDWISVARTGYCSFLGHGLVKENWRSAVFGEPTFLFTRALERLNCPRASAPVGPVPGAVN